MVRKRSTRQEWAQRVEARRASGESSKEFAARHGLNPRTLVWWSSHGLRGTSESAKVASAKFEFVEVVSDRTPAPRSGVIDVRLRDGRRLRVRADHNLEALVTLVRALET